MAAPGARVSDGGMISRRPLIPAVVAAAAALAPAAVAQSPPPTLTWDRACYTEDQPMTFTGAGFTPGGPVDLVFSRTGTVVGSYEAAADAAGAVDDYVMAREDDVLTRDQDRETMGVSAGDRTRSGQGEPPEATTALTAFTFTRWMGFSPGRYVPGRRAAVEIYGWAFAEGETAYFQFRKGRRLAASVRLGTIAGPCGDLKARPKVPKRLEPGRYRLVLSTERTRLPGRYTWRSGRVVKRPTARITAVRAPMRRAG
jgi:hypothetical protein